MLPLLYPLTILEYGDAEQRERGNYRLLLFCGCWIPFFYTFISQMIGYFGKSQVGTGQGEGGTTIITSEEYGALTSLCLAGGQYLTNTEENVIRVFGALGSIVVSIFSIAHLLWLIVERRFEEQAKDVRQRVSSILPKDRKETMIIRILVIVIPVLSIPQIWGVLRLRSLQQSLAMNSDDSYTDNQWTFGQVVAVIVFLPVLSEMGYLWLHRTTMGRRTGVTKLLENRAPLLGHKRGIA